MGYSFVMQTKLHELFEYRSGCLFWKPRKQRGFSSANKPVGSLNKGYLWVRTPLLPKQMGVHVAIWVMHNGEVPAGMVVDHIDRNTTNNSIENLRLASRSQNSMNATGKSGKLSGLPKGVFLDYQYKATTRYRAQICVAGKIIRSGNHHTVQEAEAEYKRLAKLYFKEFNIKEGD